MTDRIPLDHLTSDVLDALYEQLEAAEETESQRRLATAREALASATTRAARAETALTRIRALADTLPTAGSPVLTRDEAADMIRRALHGHRTETTTPPEAGLYDKVAAMFSGPLPWPPPETASCVCTGTSAGLNACTRCPIPWPDIPGATRIRHADEPRVQLPAPPVPAATEATDSLYDKVADMFSGPLPLPGDVPPATVLPCAWARTRQEHTPHRWQPQPGMRPVQCPGYAQVTADTTKES